MKSVLDKVFDAVILPTIAFVCTTVIGILFSRKKKVKKKISGHYFFYRVDNLININIKNTFTLSNKVKEKIFKDILSHQLLLFKDSFETLAKNIDNDPKKYEKECVLIDEVSEVFNSIQEKLYTFYLTDPSLNNDDKETLKIVMQKYYKWNSSRASRIMSLIESICSFSFYDSPEEKMCAILDSLMVVINEMLENAQKTLDSINGDLKGLSYKGEIVK